MAKRSQTILTITAVLFFVTAFVVDVSQFGRQWNHFWENLDAGRGLTIVLLIVMAGLFLALLFFRKKPFKQRLRFSIPIVFILFSVADFGNMFVHEYGLLEDYNYFTAGRDIKHGKVQLLSAGFILPTGNEDEQKAKDAIQNEFGFRSVWIGCTWTPGAAKYNAAVEDYLTQRNGNGWKLRLRQKLDSLWSRYY